jgi:hypothetical protein
VVHNRAVAKKGRKGKADQRGRVPSTTQSGGAADGAAADGAAADTDAKVTATPAHASGTSAATAASAQATATTDTAAEPAITGPAPSRAWSNALIALFLTFHVAMPLRYYVRGGGYDERFSWRMFSTLRMQKCRVNLEETIGDDTRTVELPKVLHIAWIGMLERYRRPVVDKLLARRCEQPDARSVRFERTCVDTDGSTLPPNRVSIDCASERITAQQEGSAR